MQKPCGQDRRLALLHGIPGPLSNISLNGAGMSVPIKGICGLTDRYRLGHFPVRIRHLVEHLFAIYNVPPLDWFRLNVQSGQRKFQTIGASAATRERYCIEKMQNPETCGLSMTTCRRIAHMAGDMKVGRLLAWGAPMLLAFARQCMGA